MRRAISAPRRLDRSSAEQRGRELPSVLAEVRHSRESARRQRPASAGLRRPRPPSHISIIVRDGSSSAGIANCRLCAAASSMPGPLLHENTSRGTPVVAAAESSPLEELQGVPKNAVRMRL